MAIRQDEVQLRIDFITDESKQLAGTLQQTKQYTQEIDKANKAIAAANKEIQKKNTTDVRRVELQKQIAANEALIATNLGKVVAEGKKVEKLDLNKIAPAQLVERAKQLERTMKLIPQSAPQFKQLQTELAGVNGKLKEIRDSSRGITNGGGAGGGGLFGGITALGARAVPVIGAVVAAFKGLSAAFTGANKLEQLTISFEVFLGSAEKAKQVIGDLKEFEVKTPFEAEQVNSAGRALLAFGFSTEELIPTLTKVGDVAAGTGKDFNELALIYGKAKTQGLIQGEELNQLAEAGIPIYAELAKVLGVNEKQIRKLGEQGKLQFSDLEQVFTNLTGEGGKFNNLMEKQSQSLGGLYSTVKSLYSNLLAQLGTALGPAAKDLLRVLIDIGQKAAPVVTIAFQVIGNAVQGLVWLVQDLGKGVQYFASFFTLENAEKFASNFGIVGNAVSGLIAKYRQGREEQAKVKAEYDARAKAEDERDERQLSPEEKKAIAAKEAERAQLLADRRKAANEESAKRAKEALEKQLAAEDSATKQQELLQAIRLNNNLISEEQYQARLAQIKEDSYRRQLAIYDRFGKDQTNAALEVQSQLAAIETGRAGRRSDTVVSALPGAALPGAVGSNADNSTANALGLAGLGQGVAQQELKNKFQAALISEQDYQLKSLELKRAFYAEEIAIMQAATQPQWEEIEKREQEKAKIEEEIAKERLENSKRTEKLKREVEAAGIDAAGELVNAAAEFLLADEANRKKHASTIKAFQIGEVTVSAIAQAEKIRQSVAGYPFPSNLIIGGAQAAVVAIRTGQQIAKISNTKFAGGGYTGDGFGMTDSTGHRPAGVVHDGEYVMTKRMVQDPAMQGILGFLENRRLRGYADGGLVNLNTTPTLPAVVSGDTASLANNALVMQRAAELMAQAARDFPRTVGAKVSYLDVEDAGDTLATVRSNASI